MAAMSLATLAHTLSAVIIRCGYPQCGPRGRYQTASLIRDYGATATMHDVLGRLSANCPRHASGNLRDRCDPYCPELARIESSAAGLEYLAASGSLSMPGWQPPVSRRGTAGRGISAMSRPAKCARSA
jgi:hypothetical protein